MLNKKFYIITLLIGLPLKAEITATLEGLGGVAGTNIITDTAIDYRTGDLYFSSLLGDQNFSLAKIIYHPTISLFSRVSLNANITPTKFVQVAHTQAITNGNKCILLCARPEGNTGNYFPTIDVIAHETETTTGNTTTNPVSISINEDVNGASYLNIAPNNVDIKALTGGYNTDTTNIMALAVDGSLTTPNKFCLINYKLVNTTSTTGTPLVLTGNTFSREQAEPLDITLSSNLIIHYNSDLKRVYVAPKSITVTTDDTDGHPLQSIISYSLDTDDNTLSYAKMFDAENATNTTGWGNASTNSTNHIIGKMCSGNATSHTLTVHNLTTMKIHDIYYLIVHGGVGNASNTFDKLWSIPLTSSGGLRAVPTLQVGGNGEGGNTVAAESTNLYSVSVMPRIGGTTTPWASTATVKLRAIEKTVYAIVSDGTDDDTKETSGIYYSMATVGNNGAISSWSNWARAVPVTRGPANNDGRIAHAEINILNSKIWTVPAGTSTVTLSSWAKTKASRTRSRFITRTLETILETGESNFKENTTTPVVFFHVRDDESLPIPLAVQGGTFKDGSEGIVIMRHTDEDIEDYHNDPNPRSNRKLIPLPRGASKILSVGYTNWQIEDQPLGMILVGTQNGLYALLEKVGNNFIGGYPVSSNDTIANMDDLDAGYWGSSNFFKIFQDDIKGNVVSLKSEGNGVYLLERVADNNTITNKIWRITTAELEGGIGGGQPTLLLDNKTIAAPFHTMEILVSTEDDTKEQLLIGSVAGVYVTILPNGIQNANPDDVGVSLLEFTKSQFIKAFVKNDDGTVDIIMDRTSDEPGKSSNTTISFDFSDNNTITDIQVETTSSLTRKEVATETAALTLSSTYSAAGKFPEPYWTTAEVTEAGDWTDGARRISYFNHGPNINDSNSTHLRSSVNGILASSSLGTSLGLSGDVVISNEDTAVFDKLTMRSAPTLNNGTLTLESVYHILRLD